MRGDLVGSFHDRKHQGRMPTTLVSLYIALLSLSALLAWAPWSPPALAESPTVEPLKIHLDGMAPDRGLTLSVTTTDRPDEN